MQVPKRLQVIGNLIPEGAHIADIGADHGLLEQYIALHLKDYQILAIDNKKGPCNALRLNAGCLNNVLISNSDGLNQVTSEYETIVLAGMGGDTIISILTRDLEKLENIKHIIVDAHSFIPKVRQVLIDLGFDIDYEEIVYEKNVFYIIISFKRNISKKTYTKDEIEFGYKLYIDPLFKEYKKNELSKLNEIKKKLSKIKSEQNKYDEICDRIRRLESYGEN